MNFLAMSG